MGKLQARLGRELTVYVRFLAWLNATPKPDPRARRAKAAENTPSISRMDRLKKDRIVPTLPPNPAPHIVNRLVEIGLTGTNGMGMSPLSWGEIVEWQRATCVDLAPWEARLIRRLSNEYIAESRRAEDEHCPPPWRTEVTEREKETEVERLRMVLG